METMHKCNCIEDNERDECLGILPGIINACCGHGNRKMSYVMFENGLILRGFDVVQYDLMYDDEEKQKIFYENEKNKGKKNKKLLPLNEILKEYKVPKGLTKCEEMAFLMHKMYLNDFHIKGDMIFGMFFHIIVESEHEINVQSHYKTDLDVDLNGNLDNIIDRKNEMTYELEVIVEAIKRIKILYKK